MILITGPKVQYNHENFNTMISYDIAEQYTQRFIKFQKIVKLFGIKQDF